MEYIYLGAKNTDLKLRKKICKAVRRADGKCIRGKNGSMLVEFDGKKAVVIGRLLKKNISGSNSAVECQLPKLDVAGSIPVSRSKK